MWPGPYGDHGSRKYLLASLDQSLRRMGLEYVDIFYSHRFDPDTPLEETMGALDTAVRSGRALYAGISSYSAERTLGHVRALAAIAASRGQSLAQLALSWALRDQRVTSVLIGASSVAQLEENLVAAENTSFTDDELAAIDRDAVDAGINIWATSSAY